MWQELHMTCTVTASEMIEAQRAREREDEPRSGNALERKFLCL